MKFIRKQIIYALIIAFVGFSIIGVHDLWLQGIVVDKIYAQARDRALYAAQMSLEAKFSLLIKQMEMIVFLPYVQFLAEQDGFSKYKMVQLAASELEKLSKPLSSFSQLRIIQASNGSFEELIHLERKNESNTLLMSYKQQGDVTKTEESFDASAFGNEVKLVRNKEGDFVLLYPSHDPFDGRLVNVIKGVVPFSEIMTTLTGVTKGFQAKLCQPAEKDCVALKSFPQIGFHISTYSEGKEGLFKYMWSHLLIVLLSIGVVLLIAYFSAKKNMKPIVRLIEYTRNLRRNMTIQENPYQHELGSIWQGLNEFVGMIKEREKQLMQNSAFTAMGYMASHVAHDMRSPISVIATYLKLQKGQVSDEDKEELREAAINSSDKLNLMADELVNFAKTRNIVKTVTELNRFMEDIVLVETRTQAAKKNIKVTSCLDKNVSVQIDVFKLGRALGNILQNAVEAVNAETGNIEVCTQVEEKDLKITIQDNGKGISQRDINNIFDIFYTKGKPKGTGLGLAYTQQVVHGHEGTIIVQSQKDNGASFIILIPNCVIEQARVEETAPMDALNFDKKKILLVDDESAILWSWQIEVQKRGGEVLASIASPEELFSKQDISYQKIDMALVDYEFKESSYTGHDVIKFLKEKKIKEIYLCTGYYDNVKIREEAIALGADSVRNKSV